MGTVQIVYDRFLLFAGNHYKNLQLLSVYFRTHRHTIFSDDANWQPNRWVIFRFVSTFHRGSYVNTCPILVRNDELAKREFKITKITRSNGSKHYPQFHVLTDDESTIYTYAVSGLNDKKFYLKCQNKHTQKCEATASITPAAKIMKVSISRFRKEWPICAILIFSANQFIELKKNLSLIGWKLE